jgi:hypothetical protein
MRGLTPFLTDPIPDRFGFGYDCLTSSEARYLIRTPSADRIRDRIIAAVEK